MFLRTLCSLWCAVGLASAGVPFGTALFRNDAKYSLANAFDGATHTMYISQEWITPAQVGYDFEGAWRR